MIHVVLKKDMWCVMLAPKNLQMATQGHAAWMRVWWEGLGEEEGHSQPELGAYIAVQLQHVMEQQLPNDRC